MSTEQTVEMRSYPIRLIVGVSSSCDIGLVRSGLMFVYEKDDGSAGFARVWDQHLSELVKFSNSEPNRVVIEKIFKPAKEGLFGHPSSEENVVKEVIINRHA